MPELVAQALWLAWVVSWFAASVWSNPTVKGAGAGRQIGYRLVVVAGTVLLFGVYRHDLPSEVILWRTSDTAAWALDAAVAAGFAFTWWARIHLGRLWSSQVTRKAGHHVVDTGPYGLVRHPIYTGIIVSSVATAAVRGTAVAFAGAALMTMGWYVKARLEERFLRAELGEAYAAYAGRVPMLIPLL